MNTATLARPPVPWADRAALEPALEQLPLDWKAGLALRRHPAGHVIGKYFQSTLTSVYQPIWNPTRQQWAGHEAFVRCAAAGDAGLSPWNLFSMLADDADLVALDRLCRTLHVLNESTLAEDDFLLFLNVHGRLLPAVRANHGRTFRRVLTALQQRPERIVIELPVSTSLQPRLLRQVLSNYRVNGFRVAVNIASTNALPNLLEWVIPDFIKIDARACSNPAATADFVSLAHAHDIQLILTKISDAEQLARVAHLDAWQQGYALATPAALLQRASLAA